MKVQHNRVLLSFALFCFIPELSMAKPASCNNEKSVKALDAQYEEALKVSDANFLAHLLAPNYVWVHNHAGFVDTKDTLLGRAENKNTSATGNPRSRTQRDVQVYNIDNTWVISGFTTVDKGESPTTYAFMRTYVRRNHECLLLSAQTMALEPK